MCLGRRDLGPKPLKTELLDKLAGAETLEQGLNDLFVWLSMAYEVVYDWYLVKRRPYRLAARALRWTSILSLSLTILWPAFQLVKWAEPIAAAAGIADAAQFGYLTAAIGGVAMMIDKMGGLSLAWVRHSRTAMAILQGFDELQCAWAIAVKHPGAEHAKRQEVILRALENLWAITSVETADWSQAYLSQLDALRKSLAKSDNDPQKG